MRKKPAETVGQKRNGGICKGGNGRRACRGGYLLDNILDWEHDLPDKDLDMARTHSRYLLTHSCLSFGRFKHSSSSSFSLADLNIALGTTLQINPSGTLPLKNKKFGGKMVICNLQPTKYDKKADLVISTYVDTIMEKVLKRLGVELPNYSKELDPTKQECQIEWNIDAEMVKEIDTQHKLKLKEAKKRKLEPSDERKIKIKIE